uniref:HTH La-type RNA-binding domain-containing protein n=1 Tax=Kalanchoe fedtschenkoi TaxID=63787 RepID=A0A7N0T5L9_KALFE
MATSLDEETTKKVIRQVEFYFSDSNLPRDNFLKNTLAESEDGMVSLALICSFSRMRGHLGLGDVKADEVSEETVKLVSETLKSSTFLKLSEDGKKVGRTTELLKPEEVIEQVDSRTIAATPLPYDVKVEDLETFFGQFAKVFVAVFYMISGCCSGLFVKCLGTVRMFMNLLYE